MKKHRKCMRKIVTLIITFISIINILPMEVFANSVTSSISQNDVDNDDANGSTTEENAPEAEILFEVKEKRDEHTKVYKKSDGSYTAIKTEDSLHYLDGDEWEEINNSMILDGEFYTNIKNFFNVEFPESIDSNESLTVENDGYELSFIIDDITESTAVVENSMVDSNTDISVADNAISQTQSSITYNDVAEDTDLQYVVTPNSIKENIIVSDKESLKDIYTFTFETNGLDAEKLDDGSIIFKDEFNEIKFQVPRPVMNDANFAFSYDIDVNLIENTDNTVTLEYSPSAEWTSSSERVYPVTIDPAIMVNCAYESLVENVGVALNEEESWGADTNFSNTFVFGLINQRDENPATPDVVSEIYTKINMNFFNSLGDDILFTEVRYLINGYISTNGLANGKIFAKEIVGWWEKDAVTYNTKPDLSKNVIDYFTPAVSDNHSNTDITLVHFNITKVFNEWYNGKANNGFALTVDENTAAILYLNGSVNNTALVLDYVDLSGYDENLNYHTQEAGRAGTGYVNDFTQALTVIRDDIRISDSTGTIGMVYNSAAYKKLQSLGYSFMLVYGNNWVPNYLKAIWVEEMYGDNVTYFTATGSAVDFDCSITENNEKEFKELYSETYGNHGYQLDYKSNEYILTRPDGYIEKFNRDGLLVSATAPGNGGETISITYDKMLRIQTIADSDGKSYTYYYDNESNLLSGITIGVATATTGTENLTETPISYDISYTYDDNKNLETVIFSDEKSVSYEYNNNNDMTSMENIDGYRIEYEYENNKVKTVTEKAENGDIHESGNSITYENLNFYQVKLTDATGAFEIYHFGNWGNLLYTTDSNGKYVLHSDIDSSDITHYASTSASRGFSENLLSNSSFEKLTTGEEIHLESWTNTNEDMQSTEVNPLFGSKVLKISNEKSEAGTENETGTEPQSVSISQTVDIVSIGNYVFSAYVFSDVQNSSDASLKLDISYNGIEQAISPTSVTTTNGNWDRYTVELDVPEGVEKVTVEIKAVGGSFYIDGAQLECANSVSSYNYVQNGSFNNGLNHWEGATGLSYKESSINGKTVKALELPANQAAAISQEIAVDGMKGDIFRVGGWFKGYFINSTTNNSILKDLVEQPEASANVSEAYIEVICSGDQKIKIPFNESIDDWQFAEREFSLNNNCDTVTVTIHYSENINSALLANLELTKTKVRTTNNNNTCPCVNCKIINCPCNCVDSMSCYCKQCMREDENAKRDSFGNLMLGNNYDEIITAQMLCQRVADNVTANWNLSNGFLKNVYDAAKTYTTYSYNASGDITKITSNANTENISPENESTVTFSYNNDRITTINQNGTIYSFSYDNWGQLAGVSVGGEPVVSYKYGSGEFRDRIIKVIYGDDENKDDIITFNYDVNDNSKIIVNANDKNYICQYNPNGTLKNVKLENGREINYNKGETKIWNIETIENTNPETVKELLYSYDITAAGNISETIGNGNFITSGFKITVDNGQYTENLKVESNRKSVSVTALRDCIGRYGPTTTAGLNNNSVQVEMNYNYYNSDGFFGGSVTSGENGDSDGDEEESGSTGEEATTESFQTITTDITLNDLYSYSYTYRYDNNNNIVYESISDKNNDNVICFQCDYVYDENNRLVRVNQIANSSGSGSGVSFGETATYIYEYDDAGNIELKKEYEYTLDEDLQNHTPVKGIEYNYESNNGWKDQLTSFGDVSITYDNIGNPTVFGGAILTWNGKLLEEYEYGNKIINYEYDVNGLCCRKTVSEKNTETTIETIIETYDYIWSDGRLTGQVYTNSSGSYSIKYVYDIFNSPYGFIISGSNGEQAYLYLKNLKGDIIGVVNESGNIVLTYEYDPWGVLFQPTNNDVTDTYSNVISKLPITYRGYCYDYDTGFYYIQGRWYNPEMGRFINADNLSNLGSTGTALSYNLYAYCENNPVMYAINNKDPEFANTINSNYLYNKRISKGVTGYIDNQNDGIATKLRYGIKTLEPLGCGWIATYNALIMLGNKTAPCDLIREFEMNNLFYYGAFGTNGNNLARYFSKQGYEVKITYLEGYDLGSANNFPDLEKVQKIIIENDANILFYKNGTTGHFIAIRYDGIDDTGQEVYTAFNHSGDNDKVSNISEFLPFNPPQPYVLISVSNNNSDENNSAN